MIPERRLEALLKQAVKLQQIDCLYHTGQNDEISLYVDHVCDRYNL